MKLLSKLFTLVFCFGFTTIALAEPIKISEVKKLPDPITMDEFLSFYGNACQVTDVGWFCEAENGKSIAFILLTKEDLPSVKRYKSKLNQMNHDSWYIGAILLIDAHASNSNDGVEIIWPKQMIAMGVETVDKKLLRELGKL